MTPLEQLVAELGQAARRVARYRLRCGPGVSAALHQATEPDGPSPPWAVGAGLTGPVAALTGVDLVEDPTLAEGRWELDRLMEAQRATAGYWLTVGWGLLAVP